MRSSRTIIVGGGFAGLTAATRLIQAGADLLLLERNKELGGRASSFYERDFGEWLDNGPHVFIGAYKSALSTLKIWGGEHGVDFTSGSAIPFINKDGSEVCLDVSSRGSRLGQALGLLKFRNMSFKYRLKTLGIINSIIGQAEVDPDNEPTVGEFLSKYNIHEGDCFDFISALTIAILNAPVEIAGIKSLAAALKIGLLGGNSNLGIIIRPFQQLYIEPAKRFFELSKVEVRTASTVKSILLDNKGQLSGVETESESISANSVILAIPPPDLLRLLPEWLQKDDFFKRFTSLESSPILSVHFTFDRPVINHRFAFFPRTFTHWVFTRGKEEESGGWRRLSTVTSYAPTRDEMSNKDIERWTLSDLCERLPLVNNAEVQHMKIVRTVAATWILKPGAELLRPSVRTIVKGLYLAGDWCATGLPLTIESAARSGEHAARVALTEN